MTRLGTVALLLALGLSTAVTRAQDSDDSMLPSPYLSHNAPVNTTTTPLPEDPSWVNGPPIRTGAAPVSSKTTGIVNTMATKPAPVPAPKKADPKKTPTGFAPGSAVGGGGGGGGRGGSKSQFVGTELKYATEPGEGDGKAGGGKGAAGSPTGGGGNSTASSGAGGPTATGGGAGERDEAPGLPAPGSASKASSTPTPAPTAAKKYLEGHVVLFLRAPGDEDPSPAGVKARYAKEAKIVKRVAAEVQKGEKPSTKPEEAVLRDAAPQGFYLPDEVDAWLVTADGTLVLLDADGTTFDKIAALALSSKLNVSGLQSEVELDGTPVTKVKVMAMSTDGSEPRIDGGAGYGGKPSTEGHGNDE